MTSGFEFNPQVRTAPIRKMLREWLGRATVTLVALGLLVRVSVRDTVPYLSTIYYATPWPLLSVGCFVALYLLKDRTSNRARSVLQVMGLGCAAAFCFYHYETPDRLQNPVPEGDPLKVAFWNVSRGLRGWDSVFRAIRGFDADVIGVVECNMPEEDLMTKLGYELPDFEVTRFHHGMLLLSRYPVLSAENRGLVGSASFGLARVLVGRNEVQFIVADITSDPVQFRKAPIETLGRVANEFIRFPTVIMGDFNTPIESAFLSPYRVDYVNTIEKSGHGFDCTWPVPCPVMAIDQMWVSKRWQLQSSELGWTLVSDHRPIFSELLLGR